MSKKKRIANNSPIWGVLDRTQQRELSGLWKRIEEFRSQFLKKKFHTTDNPKKNYDTSEFFITEEIYNKFLEKAQERAMEIVPGYKDAIRVSVTANESLDELTKKIKKIISNVPLKLRDSLINVNYPINGLKIKPTDPVQLLLARAKEEYHDIFKEIILPEHKRIVNLINEMENEQEEIIKKFDAVRGRIALGATYDEAAKILKKANIELPDVPGLSDLSEVIELED